jgi:Tol biopolymer transport system component
MLRLTLWAAVALVLVSALASGVALAAGSRMPTNELVYAGYETNYADLYLYDAARGLRLNLTRNPASDMSPAWSPDGSQLAFISNRDGGLHVYVIDADGGNLRRVTPEGYAFDNPRWTVDSTQLVLFARTSSGLPDVFTVHPDGSNFQQVASVARTGGMIDFGVETAALSGPQSPAGTGFLTVEFTDGNWWLFLSPEEDAPGQKLATLSMSQGRQSSVSWSADGRYIAFVSTMDDWDDVYVIEARPGAVPVRLTNDWAQESQLMWRP